MTGALKYWPNCASHTHTTTQAVYFANFQLFFNDRVRNFVIFPIFLLSFGSQSSVLTYTRVVGLEIVTQDVVAKF